MASWSDRIRNRSAGFGIVGLALLGTVAACGTAGPGGGGPSSQSAADRELPARCAVVDIQQFGDQVVSGWTTAPSDALITPPLAGMTVRQFITPQWQGEVVRLRLSNRYSQLPVTIENLHLAIKQDEDGAAVLPGSECLLTLDGQSRISIPAGGTVTTDAVVFPVQPSQSIGVSFYAPEAMAQLTRHFDAVETPYFSPPGDYTRDAAGNSFVPAPASVTNNFLLLEALEVAAIDSAGTVVAVGDSITDGSGNLALTLLGGAETNPAVGKDERYPDFLARRMLDAGMGLSVVNKGISGNQLLSAGVPQFGPALLSRFDHDVLATSGITHALLMIGTNDFGLDPIPPSPQQVIDGYISLIERAQEAGVKVVLGTITPARGTVTGTLPLGMSDNVGILHGSPQATESRQVVNAWIRSQNLSDGIVDFHACLEDPDNPGYLKPEYNSGDNLHPSSAGYAAMAQCVDLELFR